MNRMKTGFSLFGINFLTDIKTQSQARWNVNNFFVNLHSNYIRKKRC